MEPVTEEARSITRNRRTDAMFGCAYIMVGWLIYMVVYEPSISEYGQGVLTLALGTFLGYLTAMYQFETGTTRASQAKDATIKTMAESVPAAPAVPAVKPEGDKP